MPDLKDITEAERKLVKDLLITALAKNRTEKGYMTRAQVKNAWKWIDWLGGPGERL